MANPNLANVSTGYGRMAFQNVANTFANIVVNSALSNTIVKVNSLFLSNYDATNIANVTVNVSNTGISYSVLTNVSIPLQSSLIAIDKESSIYLEEGQFMQLRAHANNHVQAVLSYDIIS